MKRVYSIACIALTGMAFVLAVLVRISLVTEPIDISGYWYRTSDLTYEGVEELLKKEKADTPQKLLDETPYVLKVTVTGDRRVTKNMILSSAVVDEVYKGEEIEAGEHIDILEYIMLNRDANNISFSEGTLPLYKEHTYILFLDKKELSAKRNVQNAPYYAHINNTFYKYDVEDNINENAEEQAVIKDLEKYAIYTQDEKVLTLYMEYRNSILELCK